MTGLNFGGECDLILAMAVSNWCPEFVCESDVSFYQRGGKDCLILFLWIENQHKVAWTLDKYRSLPRQCHVYNHYDLQIEHHLCQRNSNWWIFHCPSSIPTINGPHFHIEIEYNYHYPKYQFSAVSASALLKKCAGCYVAHCCRDNEIIGFPSGLSKICRQQHVCKSSSKAVRPLLLIRAMT